MERKRRTRKGRRMTDEVSVEQSMALRWSLSAWVSILVLLSAGAVRSYK